MLNFCYIVGGAPVGKKLFTPTECDLVIAADAGYKTLDEHGIRCDLVVGDFDSAPRPQKNNIIELNPVKDDTDTLHAVNEALKIGYDRFYFYGVSGGRLDHTIASLQTLTYLLDHNAKGMIITDDFAITAIRNDRIDFRSCCKGIFSVFSFDEVSRGVSITNAKYPLCNASLTNSFPIGVSNEFIGKNTSVSVCDGTLHIFFTCNDVSEAVYQW